jgi:hypothetical protein
VISLAVGAADWVGVSSPGDYAAFKFPPLPRHDRDALFETVSSRARDLTFEYWPERVGEPRPEKVLMLSANERGQFIAPIKEPLKNLPFLA